MPVSKTLLKMIGNTISAFLEIKLILYILNTCGIWSPNSVANILYNLTTSIFTIQASWCTYTIAYLWRDLIHNTQFVVISCRYVLHTTSNNLFYTSKILFVVQSCKWPHVHKILFHSFTTNFYPFLLLMSSVISDWYHKYVSSLLRGQKEMTYINILDPIMIGVLFFSESSNLGVYLHYNISIIKLQVSFNIC